MDVLGEHQSIAKHYQVFIGKYRKLVIWPPGRLFTLGAELSVEMLVLSALWKPPVIAHVSALWFPLLQATKVWNRGMGRHFKWTYFWKSQIWPVAMFTSSLVLPLLVEFNWRLPYFGILLSCLLWCLNTGTWKNWNVFSPHKPGFLEPQDGKGSIFLRWLNLHATSWN